MPMSIVSPPTTTLDETEQPPPNSIVPPGSYQAMYCPDGSKWLSGTARYEPDLEGGQSAFVFDEDKTSQVSELISCPNATALVPTTGGFMFLFGKPLEETADHICPGNNNIQSQTVEITHGDEFSGEGDQGGQVSHDEDGWYLDGMGPDAATAGSTLSRAMRSVGWCTSCASHSCWCLPQQDDEILSCSHPYLSSDFIHSLTC
jgi:hypothetical protein